MKKTIPAIFFLLTTLLAVGQNSKLTPYAEQMTLNEHQQVNFIQFKETYRVQESEVAEFIHAMFLTNDRNSVVVSNSERDGIGYTHIRYNVYQDGFQVMNKMIIAHCYGGKLLSLNGDLTDPQISSNSFVISESAALSAALNKVNAAKYMWENKVEEELARQTLNQPDYTSFPKAIKVVLEKDGKSFKAYMFNIYAEQPMYRANVFVDATSGKILDEQNLLCTIDVPGAAATKYSGSQTITCTQNGTVYTLKEAVRGIGLGMETLNLNNGTNFGSSTSFTSASAAFTTTGFDQAATDAHWGAEKTYDYYYTQHNRNSINNSGFKLTSYVHYSTNWSNASWDGLRMRYGDGNGSSYKVFTTLDICGHEITHGLTSNSANLNYSYESGALNESYSDIFGNSIENFARPSSWNWKIGEDMTTSGNGLRSMANPNADGNPDTYLGANWYVGTGDNGGVHTNSGVSNFWYYLLVNGGSGTNDIGNAYSVTGIGFTKAAKIAFRALTVYYTPTTNYSTARNLSIQAATDLYGMCSNEVIQTINAWHAVGIGQKLNATGIVPEFSAANTNFCALPATVNFNNSTAYGFSYLWDFGDGSPVVTTTNAVHSYTANGSFNVKLTAIGCNSMTDSTIKNSYVQVNVAGLPVVSGVMACKNSPAVLTTTGGVVVKWYDATATNLVGVGSSFTTPVLTTGATYYVVNTIPNTSAFGGMASNTGGSYLTSNTQYMVFDVSSTGTLNTVMVYAATAGIRTIELRDATNTVLNTTIVNLTIGTNTVPLWFPLTVGTNYRLALGSTSAAYLYRSTSGMSYPYNIGSCISITGSSTGSSAYYWFYNWEVTKEDCSSPMVQVSFSLEACTGIQSFNAENSLFEVYPNPAKDNLVLKNLSGHQGVNVTISDASGRVILTKTMDANEEKLPLQNVASGMYILSISDNSDQLIRTLKIIKD
ncbi:MAG: M4 family metallopeptidase [bacterium]|nr:M4 family metallopeptidase [bacterium]